MDRLVITVPRPSRVQLCLLSLAWLVLVVAGGCHGLSRHEDKVNVVRLPPADNGMPREPDKVVFPDYIIEPPDILTIETIHLVPKAPYRLRSLDVLAVHIADSVPEAEITGRFIVQVGGIVDLGPVYGSVPVSGMIVDEAEQAVRAAVEKVLRQPDVDVALAELGPPQQIAGDYLVGLDGTVTLGSYGSILVAGMTVADAKANIEAYLSQFSGRANRVGQCRRV